MCNSCGLCSDGLAVCWLTFIGFTPIFGLQVTRHVSVVFTYCDSNLSIANAKAVLY